MDADYTSFGTFAPVYTQAIDRIYEALYPDRARQCEKVLRAVAEHADPLGCCYPGIYRLVTKTHYAETTVKRALLALDDLDYVRVHIERIASRKRDIVTFQVSPWVIWITPANIREAVTLWNQASSRLNEIVYRQPATESESEPAPEPATEPATNHHHHRGSGDARPPGGVGQTGDNRPRNGKTPEPAPEQGADQRPSRAQQRQQREAQTNQREAQTEKDSGSAAAVRPAVQMPSIESCRAPLTNPADEDLACRIASELSTRESQARQIIVAYGAPLVERALVHLDETRARGPVSSPFGLVKWWLTNKAITTDDAARPDSLAGRYAEYFTR